MGKGVNKLKKSIIFVVVLIILLILGYGGVQHVNNSIPSVKISQNKTTGNSSLVGSHTTGNSQAEDGASSDTNIPSAGSSNSVDNSENIDPIKAQIEKMSLEEKIGQMVIVGLDGYENDAHSKKFIEKYKIGGFILFKRNIKDTKQMISLLNSLKESNGQDNIPLFLSIDEEGGRVSRMPDEFLKIPTNKKIGKLNDDDLSYQVGSIIGEELKSFGFNMNFAPVLDINSNPKNPVIGDRSFGSEASIVAKLGIQTMKGMQTQNIISVVKHFPGHGDTAVDSHKGLPIVNHDLERLKSYELIPFSAAIENKVDVIMVAHILLPKIDADNPASLSKKIISDVLRDDMGFDGVVVTDDFTMGAIVTKYDIGEAAVKSIQAGSDIVLVCHDFDKEEAVIMALQNAARAGTISMESIDQSVYRILKLKEKYSLSNEKANSVNPQIINDKIKALF